jgi:2-C-methyl-D-erythritol 4-phosphate cytidylyltransferase
MLSANLQCWAVIPATGVGSRMGADRPKQYLPFANQTVLEHTLNQLFSYPSIDGIVLVLNENDQHWAKLDYQAPKPLITCTGGAQRHHSVFNGLNALKAQMHEQDCMVMIHDAVRPLVLHQDLDKLLSITQQNDDGALLAAPVADTLKLANEDLTVSETRSRDRLWRALTPQVFHLNRIYPALEQVISQNLTVTDDASAMEICGYHPRLVAGDYRNIKITHPQDLQLATLFLSTINKPG